MISATRKDRFWIIGGIVLALLLAAASWFLFINPKLGDTDSMNDQTTSVADQNTVLQGKVAKLKADSQGIADLLRNLDTLHTQLPTTSGLDEFTRQLTTQAGRSGVTLTSIVIGVPTAVKSATSKPVAAAADSTSESAAEPSTTASSAPTSAAKPPAVDLYAIPVTVVANGPLAGQQQLLKAIQAQGPRGALVSSVQFAPQADTAPATDAATGTASAPATGSPSPTTATSPAPPPATPAGTPSGTAAPAVPVPGGGPSAAEATAITMTVQLAVFVAPQSPEDAAALRKQLGG